MSQILPKNAFIALITVCSAGLVFAGPPSRIVKPIDNRARHILAGHIHPLARPENDRGRVAPSLNLTYVTLMLSQSESQQRELDKLLAEQQTPDSPNYHRWLTPEEYADRFGVSADDMNKIVQWAEAQGLEVAGVARGRNWIALNGDAAHIESVLGTEIHEYAVGGETHFANAIEPSIPEALAEVVRGIRGLNNFRLKPALHESREQPDYTSGKGNHYLAPNDFATIYNLSPLYAAGIDGSGQSLVIAGQTNINLPDIQQFRTNYNLPANDPQLMLVPNSHDPGIRPRDLSEANLDLEWSGAVARNAKIIYVYAPDVMQAVQYAIDQNLAPVVSVSYGSCEPETPRSDALTFQSWAKQGNAQGITWFAASGDDGGADCNDIQNSGLSVDLPAGVPEVTGVGGTEFQESGGQYWNVLNDANSASVFSYIPETVWNDSATDGSPAASGGGASMYFAQPAWQTGLGMPADNTRHVPDIALTASADHDGYLVYTSGALKIFGGTSAPTPAFAGIAALLNQYVVSNHNQSMPGLGNMNPALYALAQNAPDAFHDVTRGDNIVTVSCPPRTQNCSPAAVGYNAGVGYDSATGLGSIDAQKLFAKWNNSSAGAGASRTSMALSSNLNSMGTADVVFLTATATGAGGITPVGVVEFSIGSTLLGSAALVGSAGTATATLAVSGSQLAGSGTITATYRDNSANNVIASVNVSVRLDGSNSNGKPAILAVANGASFKPVYAPGMILSVFGTQLAPSAIAASNVPLPFSMAGVAATVNGVVAPLYYVSQQQLNIQIPYETASGPAALNINNNGVIASYVFNVAPAAPGIFIDSSGEPVPNGSAARGQIVTLFISGGGTVNPPVATGAGPSAGTAIVNLPKPVQGASVTVGGVPAAIQFIGTPVGLVGVTQINYQVPEGVGIGRQNVVVTVGGVASAAAGLFVTQ